MKKYMLTFSIAYLLCVLLVGCNSKKYNLEVVPLSHVPTDKQREDLRKEYQKYKRLFDEKVTQQTQTP